MSKVIKTMTEVNEDAADLQANFYLDKYTDQISAYESMSVLNRINESVSPFEIMAVGQMLDQFTNYREFCETQGSLASLGNVPQIALDVITASVGNSILPLLASMQPMAEEHGIVYYKQIESVGAAGGYAANGVISSPLTRDNTGDGSLGSMRKMETLAALVNGTMTYAGVLGHFPVRPYMMQFNLDGVGNGQDDGAGKILGFGFDGTINYDTGAYSINVLPDTAIAGGSIHAIYDLDVDRLSGLDKIKGSLLTKDIRAEVWALAADVGAFANFAFGQRFGRSALDEVASDLTNELTRVLNTQAVMRLIASSTGTATWSKTPAAGISYAEHKLTFVDAIAAAEANLHLNSGANSANRYLVGRLAASVLRGLPNFVVDPGAANTAVGLYGYLDGIPVIRASGIIPDYDMHFVANAGGYFNTPLAYAPFMPLMVTDTVKSPNNPFSSTTAAGVWAGMVSLNPNLTTKLQIT
jgi:hypothetical protein